MRSLRGGRSRGAPMDSASLTASYSKKINNAVLGTILFKPSIHQTRLYKKILSVADIGEVWMRIAYTKVSLYICKHLFPKDCYQLINYLSLQYPLTLFLCLIFFF